MERKRLSEVLKAEEIIAEENNRICIVSGVGSGKNWFVENELIKHGNILYVSSRRAKVNEVLENESCSPNITWEKDDDIVSMTNAGLADVIQNKKLFERLNKIIEHFQFVVIDEAHSLFSDATFAESSYHVFAFIEYVISRYPQIKVILMTGTPEPMAKYLKNNKYKVFDKTRDCLEVLLKTIRVIDKDSAFEIMARIPAHQKTVYYSNSASKIVSGKKSLISELQELGFSENEIGICMSDKRIKELKKDFDGLEEKCKNTKKIIQEKQMLDNSCRILLTTSTLKEGVNIKNKDIEIAFCESHILSEIQQFAGRIRTGLDILYVIEDVRQHEVTDEDIRNYYMEFDYALRCARTAANEYLEKHIMNENAGLYFEKDYYNRGNLDIAFLYEGEYSLSVLGGSVMPMYIKLMESSNQYLKFNHMVGRFDVYANRYVEQKRVNEILNGENGFKWLNDIERFAKEKGIEYIPIQATSVIFEEEIIGYCEEYKDSIFVDDEKKNILGDLGMMLALPPKPTRNRINKSFEEYYIPYSIETVLTSRGGKNKRGIRIIDKNKVSSNE